MSIILRNQKGSRLTFNEMDNNLVELNRPQLNIVYVNSISDLPTASSGVITLENKTYIFTTAIDLNGSRLVCGDVCNILGTSSEIASITSTGLGVGVPLITSEYTVVIENITIKDVDTAIDIDGNSRLVALDWENVNFENVTQVGTINTCDNFIFDTGSFLGAEGLTFTGTIGTIAINNSLLRGSGAANDIITVDANATVTRRFRVIYSSVIAFGSTIGINVSESATIPIEGVILDTVNFSGGGTYLGGLTYQSNKSLFVNCVGTINTTAIANMYMKNNAIATDVLVQGDRYNISGVTVSNGNNQKFTHILANNSMRYDSTIPRLFRVQISSTILSGNNNVIGIYIGVKKGGSIDPNADRISESEVYITTNGSRPDSAIVQGIVLLEQNDEVYMIVQNTSATTDITVQFINMIIERTN